MNCLNHRLAKLKIIKSFKVFKLKVFVLNCMYWILQTNFKQWFYFCCLMKKKRQNNGCHYFHYSFQIHLYDCKNLSTYRFSEKGILPILCLDWYCNYCSEVQSVTFFMLWLSCWLLITSLIDICLATNKWAAILPKRILKKEQSILLPKMFCIARITSCQYDRMAGRLQIYGNVLPAVLHISSNTCILLLAQQQSFPTPTVTFLPHLIYFHLISKQINKLQQ